MEEEVENNTQMVDNGGKNTNDNFNNNGSNSKIMSSSQGQSKSKRKMKTPFQLETLEKAYAVEAYPSEATKLELSEKLRLSDRQLQMWFCHRRLKDKKDSTTHELNPKLVIDLCDEYGSGSDSGSSQLTWSELRNVVVRSYDESPRSIMELRVIACVEAQLEEPLREDGPILGIEFDLLPPDAFEEPLAVAEQQKRPGLAFERKICEKYEVRKNKVGMSQSLSEYAFVPNQSNIRSDTFEQLSQPHLYDPMEGPTRTPPFPIGNEHLPRIHNTRSRSSRARHLSQQDKQVNPYNDASDDAIVAKEVKANERRMKKELEKQDILRKQNEKRMRKEMKRQYREREKEEERLTRKRGREEERSKREQRIERREKYLMKEHLRGRSGEDVISTLRNGSAAVSAVAKMREKGLLAPRRSRHRLTPGTVEFAAFHVLSLEGSKGLNVLELAEKIQNSGLCDLTTSKTPKVSISVALTKDGKLFERIAPSTYRVRTAFRKYPTDSESILSEARKKIQIFENGFQAGVDADNVEREESESDEVDEDPEEDDLVILSTGNPNSEQYDDMNICSVNVKANLGHDVDLIQNELDTDLPCFPENGSKDADCSSSVTRQLVACENVNTGNLDDDKLHDRLESANALKKQMWTEAQIDKVRLKDDYIGKLDYPSLIGNNLETQDTYPSVEGNHSPLLNININNEASRSTTEKQKGVSSEPSLLIEKPSTIQDFCRGTGPDNFQTLNLLMESNIRWDDFLCNSNVSVVPTFESFDNLATLH